MPKLANHDIADLAQLGERETEDLEVLGSIPSCGIFRWAAAMNLGTNAQTYFIPGLNWGPLACEASVITTRPTERLLCLKQPSPFAFCRLCKIISAAGTRTRVSWVRAKYPNQLDYGGLDHLFAKIRYWIMQGKFLTSKIKSAPRQLARFMLPNPKT